MGDIIDVYLSSEAFQRWLLRLEDEAIIALRRTMPVIQGQVRDFTPRWKGGLQFGVSIREEASGRDQIVYAEGVVAKVHELNGTWTRWPPHQPLYDWVTGKLGLAGKEAASVTFLVRRKIRLRGLTLPNKEEKGKMFARTFRLIKTTRFHWPIFLSAFKQGAQGGAATGQMGLPFPSPSGGWGGLPVVQEAPPILV